MENNKVIVNNPCGQNWDKMLPADKGKLCLSCNKKVIDFTSWDSESIVKYLNAQKKEVCGHFKTEQIEIKRSRHHQFLCDLYFKVDSFNGTSFIKKAMTPIILICMAITGCNPPILPSTKTTGSIELPMDSLDSIEIGDQVIHDSIEGRTTGNIAAPDMHKNQNRRGK